MSTHPLAGFAERAQAEIDSLYERDFFAWTQEQARLLRERQPEGIDWSNAAEELDSLGRSNKTEIRSRLIVLLMHLLKWQFQPEKRKDGWLTTIGQQRIWIEGLIEASPSLHAFPAEVLAWSYVRARRTAAEETRLPIDTFPALSPYSAEQALDVTFLPGGPWSPDVLLDD
ncbi:MAG: DUF29 domain-containing protein [Bauldia sp.]|nr:DUF29 domain-containing protein [Bauldia sp.]